MDIDDGWHTLGESEVCISRLGQKQLNVLLRFTTRHSKNGIFVRTVSVPSSAIASFKELTSLTESYKCLDFHTYLNNNNRDSMHGITGEINQIIIYNELLIVALINELL